MIQAKKMICVVLMLGMFSGTSFSATQIEWWHAMGGALGEAVNTIGGVQRKLHRNHDGGNCRFPG